MFFVFISDCITNVARQMNSIGEIEHSGKNECFWMVPEHLFCHRTALITSCWFDLLQESWRLVKLSDRDNISLYLRRRFRRRSFNRKYTVRLSLRDSNESDVYYMRAEILPDYGFYGCNFCSFNGILRSLRSEKLYHRNKCLKLVCVIQQDENIVDLLSSSTLSEDEEKEVKTEDDADVEKEDNDASKAKGVDRLVQNLKNVLQLGQNSDVVLKADEREFRVHKVILAARSSVFSSMFQHDMSEKTTGVVDIPDCSAESFAVFLEYLYSGKAEAMSPSNVLNLYYAADKYQVDDLKEECVDYMKNNLTINTVCEIIALALRHGERELQKTTIRFFCENSKSIVKTVQWQEYMKNNPTEANELIIKALNA